MDKEDVEKDDRFICIDNIKYNGFVAYNAFRIRGSLQYIHSVANSLKPGTEIILSNSGGLPRRVVIIGIKDQFINGDQIAIDFNFIER
jgi:hypothetical protein